MEQYDYYIVECPEFRLTTSSYTTALTKYRECETGTLKGVKELQIWILKQK